MGKRTILYGAFIAVSLLFVGGAFSLADRVQNNSTEAAETYAATLQGELVLKASKKDAKPEFTLVDARGKEHPLIYTDDTRFLDHNGAEASSAYFRSGLALEVKGTRGTKGVHEVAVVQAIRPAGYATYVDPIFGIVVQHPAFWENQIAYEFASSEAEHVQAPEFSGVDGSFSFEPLMTDEAATLADATKNISKRYGFDESKAVVLETEADGQKGVVIFPDSAQNSSDAFFVARYPKPYQIGDDHYTFFVLRADSAHLQNIASTVQFLKI